MFFTLDTDISKLKLRNMPHVLSFERVNFLRVNSMYCKDYIIIVIISFILPCKRLIMEQ